MKKIFLLFCLATAFSITQVEAQVIQPKWLKSLQDTTTKDGNSYYIYPYLFTQKEKESFLISHSGIGGTAYTQRLNEKDGSVIWEHYRSLSFNPYITTSNKKTGYTSSDLFVRPDGDIDLILTTNANALVLSLYGRASRFLLDYKTGKEKYFTYTTATTKTVYTPHHGSNKERYIPIEGGKKGYYVNTSALPFFSIEHATYRLDSNMVLKDSVLITQNWKDSTDYTNLKLTGLLYTGSSFCYIANYRHNTPSVYYQDTLGFQLAFYKYKKNNWQIAKSLSSAFYNTNFIDITKKLSDGFFIAGQLGAAYTAYNNNNPYPKNDDFIAKVDTNGVMLWRTIITIDTFDYQLIDVTELANKRGYCVITRRQSKNYDVPEVKLLYFNISGKFVKSFDLDFSSVKGLVPRTIWETQEGNFICSYAIANCDTNNPDPKYLCTGIFMIDGAIISKIINDNTIVVPSLSMRIFPNPAQDHFTIQFKEGQAGIATIFDLEGKAVQEYKQTFDSEQWQIPLEIMQNGLYFVQIQLENGVIQTEKIMVQR